MDDVKKHLYAAAFSLIMMSPFFYLMLRDHMKNRKLKCFFGHKSLVLDFALLPYHVTGYCSDCNGKEVRHYPSQEYLDKHYNNQDLSK